LDAVKMTGLRAIVATGWGAIELPSTIDTAKGQKMWLSEDAEKSNSGSDVDALNNATNAAHSLPRHSSESASAAERTNVNDAKTDNESDTDSESPVEEDATNRDVKSPNPSQAVAADSSTASHVPDNVFVLDAIPHDWMFASDKLQVIVHHGGAGTTGAALKAGVPSVICPFFGDHYLWSHRLWEIGAGPKSLPHHRLNAAKLAKRIKEAARTDSMRVKCKEIADGIAREDCLRDGVAAFEELAANGGKWGTATSGLTSASQTNHQFEKASVALSPAQQHTVTVQ